MATISNNQQKIIPCLWFDTNAEEAVKYYTSIFKRSKILTTSHYGDNGPLPKGTVLVMTFLIEGQEFMALNGGPYFKFTEAVSFAINCKNQTEIDFFWETLSKGGEKGQCGWLKDKYGLSWQIVPDSLGDLLKDKDPERSSRVMQAIFKMKKIDLATLQKAYSNGGKQNGRTKDGKDGKIKDGAGKDGLSVSGLKISAPAKRALEGAGIRTLKQLSKYGESKLLELHGMGPGSIPKLREALKENGMEMKK